MFVGHQVLWPLKKKKKKESWHEWITVKRLIKARLCLCSFQLESNTARYFLRSCMKTFGSRGCEATWWFPWHVLWLRHITFVTADIRWQEAEGRMHIHTYSTNTPSVCTPTLVRTKWNICSDWYETTWAARRRNLQQTEKKKRQWNAGAGDKVFLAAETQYQLTEVSDARSALLLYQMAFCSEARR